MVVQIFGTKKCQDSRKAERYFKERGVMIHYVDITIKPPSPRELENIASKTGWSNLINTESKRYIDEGLKYLLRTDHAIQSYLIKDPLLLKTPVVRTSLKASVGYQPELWQAMIALENN